MCRKPRANAKISAALPRAAPNDSTTPASNSSGATTARSSSTRTSSTTSRIYRHDHLGVAGVGLQHVVEDRRGAADQRVGAVDRVHRRRGPRRRCRTRRRWSASTVQVGGDERDAVLDDRLARRPRGSRCPVMACATSSALSALATTIDRRGVVGQAVRGEHLLARHRVELLGVGVLGRQAVGVQR